MRAAVVTKFGPPEVLQIREWPDPPVGEGDILLRVRAIGLNFADVAARLGYYPSIPKPPFVPGLEVAGVVERVGRGVRSVRPGDRVVAFTRQKAYAELVCVAANHVQRIPGTMSFEEAASIGVTYFTAYHGLITLANIRKGEKLLQQAAAGGVGTAAVQVAKLLGAEVFATVGSPQKVPVAREQGADHVFLYSREDFARAVLDRTDGYGIDVVMDSVGGRVYRKSIKLLAPMGRYVLYGLAAVTGKRTISKLAVAREIAAMPLIVPGSLISRNIGLFGFNLYFLMHKVAYFRGIAKKLLHWYEQGKIKPVIGRTFPFEEIAEAQRFLQSRESVGKVVVTI